MKRDPALLPVPTFVQPDPFPRDPKSGIQSREALVRGARESLDRLILENRGVQLPANTPFEHDAVCGAPTTLSTAAEEAAMHVSFAISAIEAAIKLDTDVEFKLTALEMICELRVHVRRLRGGE